MCVCACARVLIVDLFSSCTCGGLSCRRIWADGYRSWTESYEHDQGSSRSSGDDSGESWPAEVEKKRRNGWRKKTNNKKNQ